MPSDVPGLSYSQESECEALQASSKLKDGQGADLLHFRSRSWGWHAPNICRTWLRKFPSSMITATSYQAIQHLRTVQNVVWLKSPTSWSPPGTSDVAHKTVA